MKVRRYFAPDMKTALDAARREQGPDVMIIGQRRVDGGLELITADEYNEDILASYTPPKSSFRAVVDDSDDDAQSDAIATAKLARANAEGVSARGNHSNSATATKAAVVKPYVFPQVPPSQAARPTPTLANNSARAGEVTNNASKRAEVSRTSAAAAVSAGAKTTTARTLGPATNAQTADGPVNDTLWTRQPVIEQMHRELRSLRGLLQQQFATLAWTDMRQKHPL
ncbi:MAG: hypothetical protein U1F34_09980, partial [Gammaproteobacteria bacterium]